MPKNTAENDITNNIETSMVISISLLLLFNPAHSIITEDKGKNKRNNKKFQLNMELNIEAISKIIKVSIVTREAIKKYIQKIVENIINMTLIIFFALNNSFDIVNHFNNSSISTRSIAWFSVTKNVVSA